MSTQRSNARVRKRATAVGRAAEAQLDEMGEAAGAAGDSAKESLHDGRSFLQRTASLIDATSRQARLHPVATFGISMMTGVVVSRALRR